ncbi:MAG: class I SAM-dependent methyltransferase [Candidatus Gorgyraea atricola]|nr:class I SAM-dependent methyltransferase [Candidatus Gorgyraea atricola]
MDYNAILTYFEDSAKAGRWNSLYNSKNPLAYSFIVRLQKTITLACSFQNKKVLDLGCGTGILMPLVIDAGGQYIGLDASRKMLDEIKRIYPNYINKDEVSLIFGDIRKMRLPDNLDIMIGLGFIEYFDNPEELIQRLYNKLPIGGRLIFSFPNFQSLDYISVQSLMLFRYLARRIFGKSLHQPPRRLWDLKSAKRLYVNAGFKSLVSVNYNVNVFAYPVTRILRIFTNFWAKRFEYGKLSKCSFFATGFLISGEK